MSGSSSSDAPPVVPAPAPTKGGKKADGPKKVGRTELKNFLKLMAGAVQAQAAETANPSRSTIMATMTAEQKLIKKADTMLKRGKYVNAVRQFVYDTMTGMRGAVPTDDASMAKLFLSLEPAGSTKQQPTNEAWVAKNIGEAVGVNMEGGLRYGGDFALANIRGATDDKKAQSDAAIFSRTWNNTGRRNYYNNLNALADDGIGTAEVGTIVARVAKQTVKGPSTSFAESQQPESEAPGKEGAGSGPIGGKGKGKEGAAVDLTETTAEPRGKTTDPDAQEQKVEEADVDPMGGVVTQQPRSPGAMIGTATAGGRMRMRPPDPTISKGEAKAGANRDIDSVEAAAAFAQGMNIQAQNQAAQAKEAADRQAAQAKATEATHTQAMIPTTGPQVPGTGAGAQLPLTPEEQAAYDAYLEAEAAQQAQVVAEANLAAQQDTSGPVADSGVAQEVAGPPPPAPPAPPEGTPSLPREQVGDPELADRRFVLEDVPRDPGAGPSDAGPSAGQIMSSPGAPTAKDDEENVKRLSIDEAKSQIRALHTVYDRLIPAFKEAAHTKSRDDALQSSDKKVVHDHLLSMLRKVRDFYSKSKGLQVGIVVPAAQVLRALMGQMGGGGGGAAVGGATQPAELLAPSLAPQQGGGVVTGFQAPEKENPGQVLHREGEDRFGHAISLAIHRRNSGMDAYRRRAVPRHAIERVEPPTFGRVQEPQLKMNQNAPLNYRARPIIGRTPANLGIKIKT